MGALPAGGSLKMTRSYRRAAILCVPNIPMLAALAGVTNASLQEARWVLVEVRPFWSVANEEELLEGVDVR